MAPYGREVPILWVQEEPGNMGAWPWLRARFGARLFGRPFAGVHRPSSPIPEGGSAVRHRRDQEALIGKALL